MAIVIDGITLPELPAELLDDTYKYVTCIKIEFDGESQSGVYTTPYPLAFLSDELGGLGMNMLKVDGADYAIFRHANFDVNTNSWVDIGETNTVGIPCNTSMDGMTCTLLWTNYDVKIITAFNPSNMTYTTGDEIYFPNSETPAEPEKPKPTHGKIRIQIIEEIADAIRFLKKSNEKYPPEDFARILRSMTVLPIGTATTTLSLNQIRSNTTAKGELVD